MNFVFCTLILEGNEFFRKLINNLASRKIDSNLSSVEYRKKFGVFHI